MNFLQEVTARILAAVVTAVVIMLLLDVRKTKETKVFVDDHGLPVNGGGCKCGGKCKGNKAKTKCGCNGAAVQHNEPTPDNEPTQEDEDEPAAGKWVTVSGEVIEK